MLLQLLLLNHLWLCLAETVALLLPGAGLQGDTPQVSPRQAAAAKAAADSARQISAAGVGGQQGFASAPTGASTSIPTGQNGVGDTARKVDLSSAAAKRTDAAAQASVAGFSGRLNASNTAEQADAARPAGWGILTGQAGPDSAAGQASAGRQSGAGGAAGHAEVPLIPQVAPESSMPSSLSEASIIRSAVDAAGLRVTHF